MTQPTAPGPAQAAQDVAEDAPATAAATAPGEAPDTRSREAPCETPGREAPSRETPSREAPGRETPGRQTPSRQTPSREAPSRETPGREAPSREAANGSGGGGAGGCQLAQRWRRLLGFAIDAAILTLATGALWGRLIASFVNRLANATAAGQAGRTAGDHGAVGRVIGHTVGPYVIVGIFTICAAVAYYWLLTGYWGTTIGKRAAGARVVRAADGAPPGLRVSFLRAVIFVAGGELLPPFFVADSAWLVRDARRQCLHDKAARTLVVRTGTPLSPRSSTGRPR